MLHLVQLTTSLVLGWLAAHDLRSKRLPNYLIVAAIAMYALAAPLADTSLLSFAQHVAIALAALVTAMLMFRLGWIGGGDAKLAAAVFLWAGPSFAVSALVLASASGLVLALCVLAQSAFGARQDAAAREIPYGIALVVAGLAAVWMPADGPVSLTTL